MAKQDVLVAQLEIFGKGLEELAITVLGNCYDSGAADQKAQDGAFTQADIDAAVANAQGVDARALADEKANAEGAIADLTTKINSLTASNAKEQAVINNLKSSLQQADSSLQAVIALVSAGDVADPAPAPSDPIPSTTPPSPAPVVAPPAADPAPSNPEPSTTPPSEPAPAADPTPQAQS